MKLCELRTRRQLLPTTLTHRFSADLHEAVIMADKEIRKLNNKEVPPMEQATGLRDDQKTILVVDDDAAILKFVSGLLVESNYHVLTASSGEEALQRSRGYELEIHLLLSDFQMPVMSGIDLATELSLERPQLKVLMMSGFSRGMLILNEGWHFLAKPFIPSQLRVLIAGLIAQQDG